MFISDRFHGRCIKHQGSKPVVPGRASRATGGLHRFPLYKSLLGKRGRPTRQLRLSLACSVSSFCGVVSSKSIYDSMCSVFKCNLRNNKRKMKSKETMVLDSWPGRSDAVTWGGGGHGGHTNGCASGVGWPVLWLGFRPHPDYGTVSKQVARFWVRERVLEQANLNTDALSQPLCVQPG